MRTALIVCLWIPAVLWCDRTASPAGQVALGAVTWALLIVMLARATPMRRTQTVIVVAFATLIEYVFSAGLGVYVYRLTFLLATDWSIWPHSESAGLLRPGRRLMNRNGGCAGPWESPSSWRD